MSWMLDRDLGDVERRVAACGRAWRLRVGTALPGGHRSGVYACWAPGGGEAVLKLTPTSREAELEAAALRAWRHSGASVTLLEANVEAGALLLRRVRPATHLPPGDEATAAAVAADLLPRLHAAPVSNVFPTLAELYPFLAQHSVDDLAYERRTRREPNRAVVAEARLPTAGEAAAHLCATAPTPVLLHGDFIDKNLLFDAGGGYVAADPIPRIGDPASDVGFFAHEHRPASGILARAAAIAARAGYDVARSLRWAAVWTVFVSVSAWRDDQSELERLITSREFEDLLAV